MKTLEQYLRENAENGTIDHLLRAQVNGDGLVSFYIHPHADGDTLDFDVKGDGLRAAQIQREDGTFLISHMQICGRCKGSGNLAESSICPCPDCHAQGWVNPPEK